MFRWVIHFKLKLIKKEKERYTGPKSGERKNENRKRLGRNAIGTDGKGPYNRESVTYKIKCTGCNNVYVGET